MSPALLHLLHLCDPSLPIGGFSHSAGLETYVQQGKVHNLQTAKEFIVQQLSYNLLYTDGAFVSLAYTAAISSQQQSLLQYDETCTAIKLPKEMRLASIKLGLRLLKVFDQYHQSPSANHYLQLVKEGQAAGHYCVVFGMVAAELGIAKSDALGGFYYNALNGFVTNSVKLVPLGQQQGQTILLELFPLIQQLVEQSLEPDKERLGSCCPAFDIACMQHETLYSRLYMS